MEIDYDPAKDAANIAKHGISLARAAELDAIIRLDDDRFEELRFRAYGLIDGRLHCLAYTLRGEVVRVISLRRAYEKEFRRHA